MAGNPPLPFIIKGRRKNETYFFLQLQYVVRLREINEVLNPPDKKYQREKYC